MSDFVNIELMNLYAAVSALHYTILEIEGHKLGLISDEEHKRVVDERLAWMGDANNKTADLMKGMIGAQT